MKERDVDTSEERAARNEAVFRDANEQIARKRGELEAVVGRTPFLCECDDERCTEVVRLTADEYELVRADGRQFLVAAGHRTLGVETDLGGDGWLCVRKEGLAGRVATETDPRG